VKEGKGRVGEGGKLSEGNIGEGSGVRGERTEKKGSHWRGSF